MPRTAGAKRPQYGAADGNPLVAWRSAPHNHADQADIGRQSLRLFRPRGLSAAPLYAKSEYKMWADTLTLDEVNFTKKAIQSLESTDWGASVVRRLEVAGGIKSENMPLMFEVRYAYELSRKGLSAQYEYRAGVDGSTVEFKVCNGPCWLIELVSIRVSQAAKHAIKQTGMIYQQILASDSEDIAQSEEAEMITAEQKIGEKVFSNGKPTKFPMPQKINIMLY